MKVFVIVGVAGEYSDRSEWVVKAYMNESRARQEVETMCARSREVSSQIGDDKYGINWYDEKDPQVRQYRQYVGDPHYHFVLSDAPEYYLEQCDVVDLGWPEITST
jgi:hypothetical protein